MFDVDKNHSASRERGKSRRKFFFQLTALVGSLAFWRTITPAIGSPVSKSKLSASRYYPQPTYLPTNYGSQSIYDDPPDGFEGGSSEIVLFYRNRKHENALAYPLTIYLSPSPTKEFMGIKNKEGESIQLDYGPANAISAKYYSGMWRLLPGRPNAEWDETNAHSIVFQWQDLTVGVRGFRTAGVSRAELIKVASSLK